MSEYARRLADGYSLRDKAISNIENQNKLYEQGFEQAEKAYTSGQGAYGLDNYGQRMYSRIDSYAKEQEKLAQEQAKQALEAMNGLERFGHTLGDIGLNLVGGIAKFGENIVDVGATMFGADKDWVAKDWIGDSLMAKGNDALKGSYLNDSGFGQAVKGTMYAVGNMLPSVALSFIPGVGTALATSSFVGNASGGGMEKAYQSGANQGQALLYGGLSGAAEGLIEKLSGGIGGVGKNVFKGIGKGVGKSAVKKGAFGTLKSVGGKMIGEGLEEVASDLVDPLLSATYKGKVDYSGVNAKSLAETFGVGAMAGGIMQGGNALARKSNATFDTKSKLSELGEIKQNIDKRYYEGKLTQREYTLAIDDINWLANDTIKRLNNISEKRSDNVYNNIGQEAFANNGILREDNKYKATPIVQGKYNYNAMSPSLVGKENELVYKPTKEVLNSEQESIIKDFGKLSNGKTKIVFTDDISSADGKIKANGGYNNGVIYIAKNASLPIKEVLKHEFTHSIENSKNYNKYAEFVLNEIANSATLTKQYGNVDELLSNTRENYKAVTEDKKVVLNETVARFSERLFADPKAINRLARANKGLASHILASITSKLKGISKGGENAKTRAFLAKAEQLYRKAMNGTIGNYKVINKVKENLKYDIKKTIKGEPVVVIEKNILENVPKSQWISIVSNKIKNFIKGIPIYGKIIKVNKQTVNEYVYSKNTQGLKTNNIEKYKDKLQVANNLDEVILASTKFINEDLKHQRKDNIKEFARGEVLLQIGANNYKASVIVGLTKQNEMLLYDIVDFKKENFTIKKLDADNGASSIRSSASNNDSILKNDEKVNGYDKNSQKNNEDIKFSLKDSEKSSESSFGKTNNNEKPILKASSETKILTEIKKTEHKFKRRIGDLKLATQIQTINAQAGIEYVAKKAGIANIEEKIQQCRASNNIACECLAGNQMSYKGDIVGRGLQRILEDTYSSIPKANYFEYLYHMHNIDRRRQRKPVFMDIMTKESKRICEEYEKEYPTIVNHAKELYKYLDNLLQYRLDAGIVTQKSVDSMRKKYPHYVPTFRELEYENIGTGSLKGKYNYSVTSTIKKAKGSSADIMPLDIMIARQTAKVIKTVKVNDLISTLASKESNFVRSVPFESSQTSESEVAQDLENEIEIVKEDSSIKIEKNGENKISYFKNGERVTVQVSSEVFTGFEQFSPSTEFWNPITGALARGMSTFKKLVTAYNPFFLVRNSVRDIQSALLYTKYGSMKFFKNYAKAYNQILKNGEMWQKYRASGGLSSSFFDFDKGVDGKQNKHGLKKSNGNIFKQSFQRLENVNIIIEQAPRLAEFMSSMETGNTMEKAVADAADVTVNFSRSGKLAKKLNSTIMPFLNPAVQGASKLFRSFYGKKSFKAWAMLVGKCLLLGIGLSVLNDLIYSDDDEYKQMNYRDKENYYLIKIGSTFVKIPKGREFSVMSGMFYRSKGVIEGDKNAFDGYAKNVLSQITPVDSFSRTILSPFDDLRTNTTWYGGDIEGAQFDNVEPKKRFDELTSPIAKWLGSIFNYSPKKIHYLLDQYSGIVGDIILPIGTKSNRNIIESNFTISPLYSNKFSSDFNKAYTKAQYKRSNNVYDIEAKAQIKYFNKVKDSISSLYDEKRAVDNDKIMSKQDKSAKLKIIQGLINSAYKTGLTDFEKIGQSVKSVFETQGQLRENSQNYDKEWNDRFDYSYRETNYLIYGGEKALKDYNKTVYEKAKALNDIGVDYDKYYLIYFECKNVKTLKKNGVVVNGSKKAQVVRILNKHNLVKKQRIAVLKTLGY